MSNEYIVNSMCAIYVIIFIHRRFSLDNIFLNIRQIEIRRKTTMKTLWDSNFIRQGCLHKCYRTHLIISIFSHQTSLHLFVAKNKRRRRRQVETAKMKLSNNQASLSLISVIKRLILIANILAFLTYNRFMIHTTYDDADEIWTCFNQKWSRKWRL